jgi:hypothetical protein
MGQQKVDFGFFGGTSYYLGDINISQPFYDVTPSLGLVHIYNLNKRLALRSQLNYVKLRGSRSDFQNLPPISTGINLFQTTLLDLSSRMEINFKPFKLADRKHPVSPYVNGGLGVAFAISSSSGSPVQLILPFGAGVKVGLNRRVCLGIEYGVRKSFSDYLDNTQNQIYNIDLGLNPNHKMEIHPFINNDWYTVFGVFLTFKLFDNPGDCPVYTDNY